MIIEILGDNLHLQMLRMSKIFDLEISLVDLEGFKVSMDSQVDGCKIPYFIIIVVRFGKDCLDKNIMVNWHWFAKIYQKFSPAKIFYHTE